MISAGLLLLYFRKQEYQSFSSEIAEFITGSCDSGTIWMLIGGGADTVAGLVCF